MNDELQMLEQTVDEVLAALHPSTWEPPEDGELATEAWRQACELGWDQVGLPEDLGGLGASVAPLVALARACGRHRSPTPIVEAALARALLARAGLPQPPDRTVLTVAAARVEREEGPDGLRLRGHVRRVPWARHARLLVLGSEDVLVTVDLGQPGVRVCSGVNLAGEPRDDVELVGARAVEAGTAAAGAAAMVEPLSALLIGAQAAGALEQVLALTCEHVESRTQFGRALVSFQLVAAHLADIAAESAQVSALLADAVRAHDAGEPVAATASLKLAAASAATVASRAAHQCHGAIGVTREYRLHHYTRRLWSWRDERGGERRWSELLGRAALAASPADRWAASAPFGEVAA